MATHAPDPSYYRLVLEKISWADRATFRKELRKAFRRCTPEERDELKRWFRNVCLCRTDPPAPDQAHALS
jgi:hypothetical protein